MVLHLIRKGFMGEVASKMSFKEFRHTNMGWKTFQEERSNCRSLSISSQFCWTVGYNGDNKAREKGWSLAMAPLEYQAFKVEVLGLASGMPQEATLHRYLGRSMTTTLKLK